MAKIIVCLSGGLDSSTLLGYVIKYNPNYHAQGEIEAVSFYYGSKHNKYENKAAEEIAKFYNIKLHHLNIEQIFSLTESNLLQSGGNIPEGHYEEECMRQTVVPARNMIFISALTSIGITKGAEILYIGVHAGDHFIYPDCRPEFIRDMAYAVESASDGKLYLCAPFSGFDKTEIVKIGNELGVPYHLTRTCYKDQEVACGKCGSCVERLESFSNNGLKDPIQYEE